MNKFFGVLWAHKVAFFATFFFVFTLSYVVLVALDFLPEPPAEEHTSDYDSQPLETGVVATDDLDTELTDEDSATVATPEAPSEEVGEVAVSERGEGQGVSAEAVLPVQIRISKLGKTLPVLNPTSRTIADLDAALLEGVVRHPDSATLSQEGNIFILGHSSYLPNVFNRNFQAFNGIQDLAWGDVITVYTADSVYEYRVERVYRARAQDVTVPIAGTGNMLTLATCNSFGSVDDRYIVEARQKSVRAL